MLTTVLSFALSCAPARFQPARPPLPPVRLTTRCEGPDSVTRDHDRREFSRARGACVVTTCEGADLVSRDVSFSLVARRPMAPQCVTTRCEGADVVQRDRRGVVLTRVAFAPACLPQPVRLSRVEGWRYGVTAR
jgi:hypothetical protein